MFSEKLYQAGKKANTLLEKNILNQTNLTVFNIKENCINKLSIKMFIKRKTTVRNTYVYRMPLSF